MDIVFINRIRKVMRLICIQKGNMNYLGLICKCLDENFIFGINYVYLKVNIYSVQNVFGIIFCEGVEVNFNLGFWNKRRSILRLDMGSFWFCLLFFYIFYVGEQVQNVFSFLEEVLMSLLRYSYKSKR